MIDIALVYLFVYNSYIFIISELYKYVRATPMRVKIPAKKKSLVLKLSEEEMKVLMTLAERRGTTKSGLLRQALRLYKSVDERMQQGERFYFEDIEHKEKMEVVLL